VNIEEQTSVKGSILHAEGEPYISPNTFLAGFLKGSATTGNRNLSSCFHHQDLVYALPMTNQDLREVIALFYYQVTNRDFLFIIKDSTKYFLGLLSSIFRFIYEPTRRTLVHILVEINWMRHY